MRGLGILRKRAPLMSRIDRSRTRVNALEQMLEDSDEGSFGSSTTTSDGSVSEYQESDDASRSSDSESSAPARADARDDSDSDSDSSDGTGEEKCAVSRRGRKRSASARVLADDTSDSSDSDVGTEPVRKASGRKRLKLSDSEGETGKQKGEEAREAAAKRKERKKKLMELLKKRKTGAPLRRRRTLVRTQVTCILGTFRLFSYCVLFIRCMITITVHVLLCKT